MKYNYCLVNRKIGYFVEGFDNAADALEAKKHYGRAFMVVDRNGDEVKKATHKPAPRVSRVIENSFTDDDGSKITFIYGAYESGYFYRETYENNDYKGRRRVSEKEFINALETYHNA